ncbi:hypothetical protein HYG81_12815 [Natrinema zhouii]|uniref:Uncharacterized protein n=1 Tax=Natrinema zhouii TaxID=1710539 RepID=A0A7D6GTE2_9EURY|nr:hypothetical protein [Natrinema zhouii]QLK24984.1 hypothetical protein HYG81_12815 [Natrinema zhouii]
MNRRKLLSSITGIGVIGLAGCAADGDDSEDSEATDDGEQDDSETDNTDSGEDDSEEEYETGVVYEDTLSNLRNWQVDVVEGQTVTVEASNIGEGERLRFQVGDGTGFVHSYQFYEEKDGETNEYEIESDGQHQLQLNPDRHEAPVNEDVEIDVRMELSEP